MSEQRPAVQDLYPQDVAYCYGCGRDNEQGHHIRTFWHDGVGTARFMPQPYHLSLPGFVYGGLIASLIDCHAVGTAAARAACEAGIDPSVGPMPRYVTGSLKVVFKKPTPIGIELALRAAVREAGERKLIVDVTVSAGDVVTATGEVVAVRMPETMRAG